VSSLPPEQQPHPDRLAALLAVARDAVIGMNMHGFVTLWNRGATQMLGYTEAEAVGRRLGELLFPPHQWASHCEQVARAAHGKSPLVGRPTEMPVLHAQGHEVFVELMLDRIEEPDGSVSFLAVLRDLTERRSQEARLAAVLAAMGDGVVVTDGEGRVTLFTPAAEALTGLSAAATLGRGLDDVLRFTCSHTRAPMHIAPGVACTVSVECPWMLHRSDGAAVPVAVTASSVGGGLVITLRDVTEARAHAEAVHAQRERLTSLLATTSAMIYSTRLPDFAMEYISDSAALLLGHTAAEMSAPGFWGDAIHPDDRERVLAAMPALLAHGRHVNEYRFRHRDGSYRWVRDEARLVYDADGAPVRAIGASFDITARKAQEHRLASLLAVKRVVLQVSRAFLGARGANLHDALREALAELGHATGADGVCVLRVSEGEAARTHSWSRPGRTLPGVESAALMAALDAPAGASATRIVVPMVLDGARLGAVVLDRPRVEGTEPGELAAMVQLVADAVVAGFKRVDDEAALERLNAGLAATSARQRALLDLSMELARTARREGVYESVRRRLHQVLGVDRVSLMEIVDGGARYAFRLLDEDARPEPETGDFHYVHAGRLVDVVDAATRSAAAVGLAVRTGRVVSTREHDVHHFADWAHLAANTGYTQFVVMPLFGAQGVCGTLNLGYAAAEPPDGEFLDQVAQFASLLGAHLAIHEAREAREALHAELEQRVEERTRALAASEERFERLFQEAPQAMLMVDPALAVAQSNRAAQTLFGYDADGLDGTPLRTLVPDDLRARHDALMRDTFATQRTTTPMTRLRTVSAVRRDGSHFDAEVGLVPIAVDGRHHVLAGVTDVSARNAAQAALTTSLREKETLLKEIHHRVKNNLQIISSLLALQSDQMPSPEARALLQESVFRVRSMALIHQQLYSVDSLERIGLGDYARNLTESLRASLAPAARVAFSADAVAVSVETAVPLGLILNELVTNAFKYGMGGPASPWDVRVRIAAEGDADIRVEVHDAGPGLPEGIETAPPTSLGLQLVRSLVRQLRAQLTVTREGGARVVLLCPHGARC
jgi:PAS domain S-box-containing protein